MGWAEIALAICKGVLGAIGAKAFNDLFGDDGIDMDRVIREFVAAVRAALRTDLDAQKRDELEASVSALQILLRQYGNNHKHEMLEPLRFKATDLTEQCKKLGLPTVAGFGVSGSAELLVLSEMARLHMRGQQANTHDRAKELIAEAATFAPRLESANEARFGPVVIFSMGGNAR